MRGRLKEGIEQKRTGARARSLVGRLLSSGARSTAPLLLVPMVALIYTVSAERAAAMSFDIVFTCDYGCTTGVDAPEGSLSIEDSILLDSGNFDSFVAIAGIEVTAFGHIPLYLLEIFRRTPDRGIRRCQDLSETRRVEPYRRA